MKKVIVVATLGLLSVEVCAGPVTFKGAEDASAVIFGDYNGRYNDSQGALYIGGNANINNYSVGTQLSDSSLGMFVGGNLSMKGGDVKGSVSVNGKSKFKNARFPDQSTEQVNLDKSYYDDLSRSLSEKQTTSSRYSWGRKIFTSADEQGTAYLQTNTSELSWVWGLFTEGLDSDTRLIVNIAGSEIYMGGRDWLFKDVNYDFNFDSENVLFNFFEAKTLTVAGGVYGSILAPNADVFGEHGHINGQLIANSFDGSTQLNYAPFNTDEEIEFPSGNLESKYTEVSEPATFGVFAGAFVLMMGSSLRRNSKKELCGIIFIKEVYYEKRTGH